MTMQETIQRNMLRHHVSTQIFCRPCGRILDITQAVSIDVYDKTAEHLLHTSVACSACHEKRKALIEHCAFDNHIEYLDGRLLFAKPARAKRQRKAAKAESQQ